MSQVLDDLVNLLTLEPIEENLFRGSSQDLGFRQLFGGQHLQRVAWVQDDCQAINRDHRVEPAHESHAVDPRIDAVYARYGIKP